MQALCSPEYLSTPPSPNVTTSLREENFRVPRCGGEKQGQWWGGPVGQSDPQQSCGANGESSSLSTVHLNLHSSLRGFQIQVSKGAGLVTCGGENVVGRGGALGKLDLAFDGRHSELWKHCCQAKEVWGYSLIKTFVLYPFIPTSKTLGMIFRVHLLSHCGRWAALSHICFPLSYCSNWIQDFFGASMINLPVCS